MLDKAKEVSARPQRKIPWFGARKFAAELSKEVDEVSSERDELRQHLDRLGALSVVELAKKRIALESQIKTQQSLMEQKRVVAQADLDDLAQQIAQLRKTVVVTEELLLLQEAGVYKYRHPLSDAVQYEAKLADIESQIKEMAKKDGGAVLSVSSWQVNGSEAQGRAMVRDFSKLMLRAYNAEADNLVRALKPYRLDAAIDRLNKVTTTIERLGKTMQIQIADSYHRLRIRELELTADYVQKQAEEKEAERQEKERLREERKVQQEIERERAKLEKERSHYANALAALEAKGDDEGAARLRAELEKVDKAIEDVDFRAANIRAGYVYVISNIGSFGESIVKVGMTRRLDPMDRIRELSDASVPFNFDVHALFFSADAVGIESAMHQKLIDVRVNTVNRRREFFRATPLQVKGLLSQLTGELLEFQDLPEALEYRQCLSESAARNAMLAHELR